MGYYMGIDLGTSAVKVVICDERGSVAATGRAGYPCRHPRPGWSEQEPEDWHAAAVRAVREALSHPGVDASRVVSMGVSGQMHGLVLLDGSGRVLRPAMLWNDGRSTAECALLNDGLGRERLSALCANIAFPGFTAPKLLWVRAHEPEVFRRVRWVLLPKDYLVYRLTGALATDVSDASGTLYFDVAARSWSAPMLDLLGITEGQLPAVHESWERIGALSTRAAAALGLSTSVTVCAGAGDNAAAAVGMGTVREGQCNVSLGTSGTVFLPTEAVHVDEANALHAFADATGSYHLMGCILSAASANDWWVRGILRSDLDAELAGFDRGRSGDNEVLFLPYLMGERSPINDAGARAAFFGMSASTTRLDMVRSVMEGVAFALRECLEAAEAMGVRAESLTACGGGARSRVWRQILSDVLNKPVDVSAREEGPGFGACVLAMVGSGLFESVAHAAEALSVDPVESIEPDPRASAAYERRYQVYRRLYPALRDVYALAADIPRG